MEQVFGGGGVLGTPFGKGSYRPAHLNETTDRRAINPPAAGLGEAVG